MKGKNGTVNLSLLVDNMIVCAENPKDYRQLLEFNKILKYKVNIQKSIVIIYAGVKQIKLKF